MTQQADIQRPADVRVARKMQPQATQVQFTQMTITGDVQAQGQQRAVTRLRIIQRGQFQRLYFSGVAGTKATGDTLHRLAFKLRIAQGHHRRPGLRQRLELQHAE